MEINKIYCGSALDVLKTFPDNSIDCVVTSPPYWGLRDYGMNEQLGLEPVFQQYIDNLCTIFDEVKRVLKDGGTCWVNLGDTYSGSTKNAGGDLSKSKHVWNFQNKEVKTCFHCGKEFEGYKFQNFCSGACAGVDNTRRDKKGLLECKSLNMIPARFAIEMTNRGWILRNEIIWHKPNCMPASVKDRFTVDFEKIFFFVKKKKYYFEQQFEKYLAPMDRWGGEVLKANGISNWNEGTGQDFYRNRLMRPNPAGRNKRVVWRIKTKPFKEAHFAVFPPSLIRVPILAGCPEFICDKCGKPKQKIFENGEIIQKGGGAKRSDAGLNSKPKIVQYEQIESGYTNCDCGAGFHSGIVLDPFMGAGTTALTALQLNRYFIGIELNPEYIKIAGKRIKPYLIQQNLFTEAV